MSRRKIGAALKRICDYEGIVLSRDEVKFHIDRLSDDVLDEIVLDYLKDENVLTA